jgi:hypothetical protein
MAHTGMEIANALKALEPNSIYAVHNSDIDNIEWLSDDITQPSKSDIEAKIAEQKTEYDNLAYARARAVAYKSIQDQLDMQYWDQVNGTTTWKDHIAKVKSDNPKP